MQIIPTIEPSAKRSGETLNVELQEDLSLTLTLDQAVSLYYAFKIEVIAWLNDTKRREPESAEVIAFPVHASRVTLDSAVRAARELEALKEKGVANV